ncbi:MAG: hypothetical protein ACRD0U_06410, partial [Acidimicrobiales bacterium]
MGGWSLMLRWVVGRRPSLEFLYLGLGELTGRLRRVDRLVDQVAAQVALDAIEDRPPHGHHR